MIATETKSDTNVSLNASDRCDRCRSQAYVRVTLPSMLELLFCIHDFKTHQKQLEEIAIEIVNESDKLV